MTPSLRSSFSESPSGKAADSPTSANSKTTPRKSPTCKTCGQRRVGHPRSGCPTTPSPSPLAKVQDPEVTDALQSLQIKCLPSDDKATIRARRRSSGVKLVQEPGMITDDLSGDEGQNIRVAQWQETIQSSTKLSRGSPHSPTIMPGTLNTPSSSFFWPEEIPPEHYIPSTPDGSVATIRVSPAAPKPLARSLSVEERNDFLSSLAEASPVVPATVFQFPIHDISTIQLSAMKLGFFSRVIPGQDGVNGYLILGRDDASVQGLFDGAREQARRRVGSCGGKMGAAAGGAVVGAVATFTGLALS